jgi:hypothetical protein
MVPPNGVSAAARTGSTWMNWWSSVASANLSIISWVTSRHGETPISVPTAASSRRLKWASKAQPSPLVTP